MAMQIRMLLALARRFPRGHLLASTALLVLLGGAMVLPEYGQSSQQPETRSLALPKPSARSIEIKDLEELDEPQEWIEIAVNRGDTLGRLLQNNGVSAAAVHRLVTADERLAALSRIRPGDQLRLLVGDDGELQALEYRISRIESLHANLNEDGWQVSEEKREYHRQLRYAQATIEDSLFMAGQRAGMTDNLTMQLANIFGWDIDFVMDIRRGDEFRVLYEELFIDGERVGTGNIIMAEFTNRDRLLSAIRYEVEEGRAEYFDPQGNSMRREFLRTPVEFSRISSRFNLNRRHPVLNTIRAHRGVDYAAPTGTPIRAAGDGRVEFVGVRGGYGNVVIIRHGQKYSTLYAHMNGFARGMRNGVRVRQGQVIGYVGMTGLATGPHLHYEFLVNGVHRNPLTIDLPQASGIESGQRRDFLVHANRLRNQMALHAEAFTLAQTSP